MCQPNCLWRCRTAQQGWAPERELSVVVKQEPQGHVFHFYHCQWLIPGKIYSFEEHHFKTYILVKGLLWLLLSQGSHFVFLFFNVFLCTLVFNQPLRCLDEKDLHRTGGVCLPADYGQKSAVSGKWNPSLRDPIFYRTMDAHAGAFVCMFLAHGYSLQPRPAQEEVEMIHKEPGPGTIIRGGCQHPGWD